MLIILTKLLVYLPWFHLIMIFLPNVLLSLFTKIIGLEITLDVHVLGIYHLDHCSRENPGTVLNKNIVVWLQGWIYGIFCSINKILMLTFQLFSLN